MRKLILVTLTISVLTISGCCTHAPMAAPPTKHTDVETFASLSDHCKKTGAGNQHNKKPLVCVTLFPGGASVDPVVIEASKQDGSLQPNKIRFVARPLGTSEAFEIEIDAGCVTQSRVDCPRGECFLDVRQNVTMKTSCEYAVVLNRVENGETVRIKLDPIVIIDTN